MLNIQSTRRNRYRKDSILERQMHWLLLLVLVLRVVVIDSCIADTEWTHHIRLYGSKQRWMIGELWGIQGVIAWIWS